jgi:hypothetical protein
MKLGVLCYLSLILLVASAACSGTSSGSDTAPTVQNKAAGGSSDRPKQDHKSSGEVPGEAASPALPSVEWPLAFKGQRSSSLTSKKGSLNRDQLSRSGCKLQPGSSGKIGLSPMTQIVGSVPFIRLRANIGWKTTCWSSPGAGSIATGVQVILR